MSDHSVAAQHQSFSSHPIDSSHDLESSNPIRDRIRQAVIDVHEQTPLAQSFTNFVTINLVANAQLASGGTAAMSFLPDDIIDIAAICGATYINVGTLLPFYQDALASITQSLSAHHYQWVLDPVAAGLGKTRTAILQQMRDFPPTIIRANASEIMALDSLWQLTPTDTAENQGHAPAGVESADEVDVAIDAAKRVALLLRQSNNKGLGAVAISGEIDCVTDGERVFRLPGGDAMMTKITGAGCALGGVTATYLCVSDPIIAALSASLLFNRASELAAQRSHGPGSFQTELLDAFWTIDADTIAQSPIIEA